MKNLFTFLFAFVLFGTTVSAQLDNSVHDNCFPPGDDNSDVSWQDYFENLIKSGTTINKSRVKFNSLEDAVKYVLPRATKFEPGMLVTLQDRLSKARLPKGNVYQKVNDLISTSDDISDFRAGLLQLASPDLPVKERDFLVAMDYAMQYYANPTIKVMSSTGGKRSIDTYDSYSHVIVGNGWTCAAAIVGGVLAGGLEGAAAGATVGAIGGPGGAGSGAVVGGIIGGIAGGLVGGAAGCGSSK